MTEQEQILMFGRLRHWAVAGAVLPGLAVCVSASSGYLAEVGPVPLRFLSSPPATNRVRMPLPPPEAPPVVPSPPVVVATNAAPAVVSTPAAPVPDANPLANSNTSGPVAAPPGQEPMISPRCC